MARPIIATEEEITSLHERLKAKLTSSKWAGGKIEVSQDLTKNSDTAHIIITPLAWLKMTALVDEFSSEVQWNGLVRRVADNVYEVYDVLVFPHKVSSTTVISDPVEYGAFLSSLSDEQFYAVKFHGHSHVNMGVTPSGTDMKLREDILTTLSTTNPEAYYIFLIINKKGEWSGEIYDVAKNALYSSKYGELTLSVPMGEETLSDFIANAKRIAVPEKITPPPAKHTYSGDYYSTGSGYYGAGYYASSGYYNDGVTKKGKKKGGYAEPTTDSYLSDDELNSYYGTQGIYGGQK